MPMGFYQPAQIIIDARKHGVEVRPIDINYSLWDNQLERIPSPKDVDSSSLLLREKVPEGRMRPEGSGGEAALRLGFRQVRGLRQDDIDVLIAARKKCIPPSTSFVMPLCPKLHWRN
jgi:error-prone DNA polymerase